jgi:UDP-N-acetylmuramoyl-L-alanyl-D-glutamate--2,6-diaminopimelate ligase
MTPPALRVGARVSSGPVAPSFPSVSLFDLLTPLGDAEIRGDPTVRIIDLEHDSRRVAPGALFMCVPGGGVDGHDHAGDAWRAGAVALLVERWLDLPLPQARVASVRAAMGPVAARAFGDPARSMTTVGVTGTNGKTTVTYLLERIFDAAGRRPGVIGTTGARIDGRPEPLAFTTPEPPELHRLLARMHDDRVEAVAMEVSSHAMAMHRADGVVFDAVGFTNLSQDHLDFHPSMESYFEAKAALFTPEHAERGVVDLDDLWGHRLGERAAIPTTGYAIDADAPLRARDVSVSREGVAFTVDDIAFRSSLRGRFNVSNCLAAIGLSRLVGIDDDAITRGIAALEEVPGRMQPLDAGQNFLVVVDYAHTPDSILSVLQAARPLTSGRLIVVFGCGGDRDRAKRPLMGAAATRTADLTVITSDNPRSEDPLAIIADIEPGAAEGGGAFVVEPDRRAAIRSAIRAATSGDTVVIAGKGHESYQETGGLRIPFDDREVAREEILARERT